MTIIQGSNSPITLIFSQNMSSIKNFNASLWHGSTMMKRWSMSDINIIQNEIELPLTEKETLDFISGRARIEAKWIPEIGDIELANEVTVDVESRKDKTEVSLSG